MSLRSPAARIGLTAPVTLRLVSLGVALALWGGAACQPRRSLYAVDGATGATAWTLKACCNQVATGEGVVVAVQAGGLRALAPADGRTLWRDRVQASPTVAPVVDDEHVVAADLAGGLRGIDARTGHTSWSLDPSPGATWTHRRTDRGPVYVDDRGVLHGLEPASGADRFSVRLPEASSGAVRELDVAGDLVTYETVAGVVRTCEIASGATRWTVESSTALPFSSRGDAVYVLGLDRCARRFDRASGSTAWESCPDERIHEIVATADTVYLAGSLGELHALEAGTGEVRWSVATGGTNLRALLRDDGVLLLSDGDGVRSVDARTGRLLWHRPGEGRIRSGLLTGDGRLVIREVGDSLLALDAASGSEAWSSPLRLQGGDRVLVFDSAGGVHAL